MRVKLLSLFCVMFLLSVSYASGRHHDSDHDSKSNDLIKQVTVKEPTFTVKLAANATTGYMWYIKKIDRRLQVVNYKYKAPNSKLMGAPGEAEWTFTINDSSFLKVPQIAKISFEYARPWDVKDGESHTIYFVSNGSA